MFDGEPSCQMSGENRAKLVQGVDPDLGRSN